MLLFLLPLLPPILFLPLSVKSSQVKSSPACHNAASWRSRQKNATLQLYKIRHCVKLRLSMTSRPLQIHSEQNPFKCHDCVQSCTKSKKASHATSKKVADTLIPAVNSRKACESVGMCIPGMRAPLVYYLEVI